MGVADDCRWHLLAMGRARSLMWYYILVAITGVINCGAGVAIFYYGDVWWSYVAALIFVLLGAAVFAGNIMCVIDHVKRNRTVRNLYGN